MYFLKKNLLNFLALMLIAVLPGCTSTEQMPSPPETRTETVVDSLHGVEIADNYRWLEDQWSDETRTWIDTQNSYTDLIMDEVPGREPLKESLTRLMKVDSLAFPREEGDRYFYSRRSAEQDLSVIYWKEGLEGQEKVLIDPHPLSEDHTISVGLNTISQDGKLVVYSVREGGVDETSMKFLEVDTGKELADILPKARYYGFSLVPDKSGFYYARRDPEGARLYYRAMGSEPTDEKLVFGEGIPPAHFVGGSVTRDGRWLFMSHTIGWNRNNIYLKDLRRSVKEKPLVTDKDGLFYPMVEDGRLFIRTNFEAPNWKLMTADLKNPGIENWKPFIPERENAVMQSVSMVGGKIFVRYLENVQSKIKIFKPDGSEDGELVMDSIGTVGNLSGHWDKNEAFYSFSSFHIPSTIYRYDVSTGVSAVFDQSKIPFESDKYEVEQVRYPSKDGTEVPMFIVASKDLKLNGNHHTYLTGYGGFNSSSTPGFSTTAAAWLETGGVYAVANLRGGGEFGEKWHRAGMLENKQNVFDDFIAAGEFLIAKGYTTSQKLGIRGGSNGGLLVTAMMTQRPDLFGAIVCTYPLIDMIRYHTFLVGSTWVSEYGSADDPAQFEFIHAYSPYQHVKQGEMYPATLFITGDGDTRVDPCHARKMTALTQSANNSNNPIMLRYHTKAGHSGGQPLSERIDNQAETLHFLLWRLGANQQK